MSNISKNTMVDAQVPYILHFYSNTENKGNTSFTNPNSKYGDLNAFAFNNVVCEKILKTNINLETFLKFYNNLYKFLKISSS